LKINGSKNISAKLRIAISAMLLGGAGTVYAAPQPFWPKMPPAEWQAYVEKVIAEYISPVKRPTAPANSVPRAFDKPDFSGMWKEEQGVLFSDPTPGAFGGAHPGWDDTINPPPYNAEWQKKYDDYKKEAISKKGPNRLYDCDPSGMPRIMTNPFPMEVVQTKDILYALFQFKSQIRRIYNDGRPHPSEDDYDPSYMGHSTGKWDGETLVVETKLIGNFPGKMIQGTGITHSDQLSVVERIRFLTPDQIEWEITMTDPVAFTKPWVSKRSFGRYMKGQKVDVPEYECTARENLEELGYIGEMPPKKSDIVLKPAASAPAPAKK
jgi:hypothetical protein